MYFLLGWQLDWQSELSTGKHYKTGAENSTVNVLIKSLMCVYNIKINITNMCISKRILSLRLKDFSSLIVRCVYIVSK